MELFKKLNNVFLAEQEKVKLDLDNTSIEVQKLSDNLVLFDSIEKQLDLDIQLANVDDLKKVLNSLNITSVSDEEINTFEELKKIVHYLYDPRLPDVGIKHAKLKFLEEFKNKIKNIFKEINDTCEQLKKQCSEYNDLNEKFNYYMRIMKDDKFYLSLSVEELNDLFDFLDFISVERKLVLDIIAEITINRLRHIETLQKQTSLEELPEIDVLEEEINKNANRLIGEEKKDNEEDREIDLSFLSDEEKQWVFCLETLFLENNTEGANYIFELLKEESSDFDLEKRKANYYSYGELDWSVIYADYYSNLLPSISTHKEEVLTIIKYVVNADKAIKQQKTSDRDELQKQTKAFKVISSQAKELVDNCYANSGEICLDLSESKVQELYGFCSQINALLNDTSEKIVGDDVNSNDLQLVNAKLSELISSVQEIINSKNVDIDNKNVDVYKLDTTKTLILLLKDKDGNFVPVREIENESHKDINSIKTNELQKAIVMISERGMSDNKKKFCSSHVDKKGSNGSDILLRDHFGFDVDRIRFVGDSRTGYVIVPVHEENRKKLTSVYGDNVFSQNYNSIVLIVTTINCFATHSEYDAFKDLISENLSYVSYILNLFKNPNANVEEMMAVIEDSAEECKKLSSGYGRGGK